MVGYKYTRNKNIKLCISIHLIENRKRERKRNTISEK